MPRQLPRTAACPTAEVRAPKGGPAVIDIVAMGAATALLLRQCNLQSPQHIQGWLSSGVKRVFQ
jgi:hypothetical protein